MKKKVGNDRVRFSRDREQVWDIIRRIVTSRRDSFDAILLSGERGIGKSVIWAEGLAAARAAGLRVLSASTAESELSMPYVVLDDLLGDVIDEALPSLSDQQRQALETALLRAGLAEQPPPARLIASAVCEVLRWCAGQSGVIVAVDDLQWADASSQQALAFALRRLSTEPITLLATVRTASPLNQQRASEADGALLSIVAPEQRMPVPPLSASGIKALIEERIGIPVFRTDAELITSATRGNPFWSLEFGIALKHDKRLPGTPLPIPDSVQGLVDPLIKAQPPEVASALCVVSALGSTSVPAVIRVLRAVLSDPARAVDDAVACGLIRQNGSGLVPAHPLLSVAAMKAIPPTKQLKLHRALADTAESPEIKAAHLVQSIEPGELGSLRHMVADAFDAAVESARTRGATALAAELAEQAMAFTDSASGEMLRRRATAARLHATCGNLPRVLDLFDSVDLSSLNTEVLEDTLPILAAAEYLLNGESRVRAVLTRAGTCGERDPRRLALLYGEMAGRYYGEHDRREEYIRRALACAEQAAPFGTAVYRAYLQLIDLRVDAGDGLDAELLARAERMETEGVAPGNPYSTDFCRVRGLIFTDRLTEAQELLQRCLAKAQGAAYGWAASLFSIYQADVFLLLGRLDAASASLAESEETMDWGAGALPCLAEIRGRLLFARGRTDEVVEFVDRLGWSASSDRWRRMVANNLLGLLAARRGDHLRAAQFFQRSRDSAEALGLYETGARSRVDTELGEQLALAGRFDAAVKVAEELLEAGHRGNRCTLSGVGKRILGLCAVERGDLAAARTLLTAAVDEHEHTPLRLELGRSLLELGSVQRRCKERRAARHTFERAIAIFADTGFVDLLGRAKAELDRIGGRHGSSSLTAAEQRVVELVAAGATNKEAAAALRLGIRTVESHLAAAYRKLKVRSRVDLALLVTGKR